MKKTRELTKKYLEPLLNEFIPVVCGFLGRDNLGNITTLGRGGSDITALLLANCLEADEAILVKDTRGIQSADPMIVPNAEVLDNLDIHEMFALAKGGAKIIRSEALKYKLSNQKLRIVSFSSCNVSSGGTEIIGNMNQNSAEINKYTDLTAITVVSEINSTIISNLFSLLHQEPIFGVSTGKKSITIFARLKKPKETINRLHNNKLFKAISHQSNIALIEVTHQEFVDSPGWVAQVTSALAEKNINITEVTTSKATINIFIDEERTQDSIRAISEIF
jgi:aspartate kinase